MARKPAGGPKNRSAPSSKAAAAAATSASVPSSSTPRPVPPSTSTYTMPSSNPQLYISLIFLLIPMVQMLWSAEAPKRPFSLLKDASGTNEKLIEPKILLVSPHPDDELIVAPTILSLLTDDKRETSTLYALCLSTGDLGGGKELGEKRTQEWKDSWDVLGLPEDRRFILDVPKLKDSNSTWDPIVIAEQVAPFVLKYDIDTILTFDDGGITGHPNHVSVLPGLKHMLSAHSFTKKLSKQKGRITPRIYALKTSPWTKNYGLVTPIVEHLVLGAHALMFDPEKFKDEAFKLPTIFLTDVKSYVKAWKALLKHQSQLNPKSLGMWLMGRYMWINEWEVL